MWERKKSTFLINKYKSLLKVSLAVEGAAFLVTFTDTLLAGNMVGAEALAAVAMVAPFALITTFLASMINSGTIVKYAYCVGAYDRKHANKKFSQGLLLATIAGVCTLLVFELGCDFFVSRNAAPDIMRQYLREYFRIQCIYLSLDPVSVLLDNTILYDGGEKLSAAANVTEIIGNVVLSIIFGRFWGVAGIALASVVSKIIFLVIICFWFFSKKNTLRFSWYLDLKESAQVLKRGVVKASPIVLRALTEFVMNAYILWRFGLTVFVLWGIAQRFIGIRSFFVGLSQAVSPLVGTLRGENNTLELRSIMDVSSLVMFIIGGVFSLFTVLFADLLVRSFGITDSSTLREAGMILRIIGASFLFQALATHLFSYYFMIEKRLLTFLICAIKDFIAPLGLGIAGAILSENPTGLWIGISLSPLMSLLIILPIIYRRYGRAMFPYLISVERDAQIFFYDLELTQQKIVDLSGAVVSLLKGENYSERTQMLAGVLVEDVLLLTMNANHSKSAIHAECTIFLEDSGVRVILRDSGIIQNITHDDADVISFRQYFVTQVMDVIENKFYITTTGYNRNEYFIKDK